MGIDGTAYMSASNAGFSEFEFLIPNQWPYGGMAYTVGLKPTNFYVRIVVGPPSEKQRGAGGPLDGLLGWFDTNFSDQKFTVC